MEALAEGATLSPRITTLGLVLRLLLGRLDVLGDLLLRLPLGLRLRLALLLRLLLLLLLLGLAIVVLRLVNVVRTLAMEGRTVGRIVLIIGSIPLISTIATEARVLVSLTLGRVAHRLLLISELKVLSIIIHYIVLISGGLTEDVLNTFLWHHSCSVKHLSLNVLSVHRIRSVTDDAHISVIVPQTLNLLRGEQDGHGGVEETDLAHELNLADLLAHHHPCFLDRKLIMSCSMGKIAAALGEAAIDKETAHVGAPATAEILIATIEGTMAEKALSALIASLIMHNERHQHHGDDSENKHDTTELRQSMHNTKVVTRDDG